jgi:hypothetical protein
MIGCLKIKETPLFPEISIYYFTFSEHGNAGSYIIDENSMYFLVIQIDLDLLHVF